MPLTPGQTPAQIAAAHAADDFEKVRTHPLRTFQRIDRLLDDAIHALNSGSYSTAREFIERVQEAGVRELAWLREQRK